MRVGLNLIILDSVGISQILSNNKAYCAPGNQSMTLTLDPQTNTRVQLVIHSLCLSCLGEAIFLQVLVFSSILGQGYFRAVETNSSILAFELLLIAFTTIYFIYLYQKTIRSSLKRQTAT